MLFVEGFTLYRFGFAAGVVTSSASIRFRLARGHVKMEGRFFCLAADSMNRPFCL